MDSARGVAEIVVCCRNSQAILDGGVPARVATLKIRKGASDALNKRSGALGKMK